MKQRSGLGKKVSSIFDGVALPGTRGQAQQSPPSYRPADMAPAPRQLLTVTPPPRSAGVAPPRAPRTIPVQTPQLKVAYHTLSSRVSDSLVAKTEGSGNAWQRLIYKLFFSGNLEVDARNRKTLALVGGLFVIVIVVILWSRILSGSSPISATKISVAKVTTVPSTEAVINWTTPELYPTMLRDPMEMQPSPQPTGDTNSVPFVIKSIVYVNDNPQASTAMINGQMFREGQSVNGATIVRIDPKSVEFTANGKNWKQQVQ